MLWTTTSLCIQIVAGFAGAHIAAAVVHDHAFGFWGHTIVGLVAGVVGGYFLQTYAVTVVTGSGSLNEVRPADVYVLQAVTGAALGGICMMAVGMVYARR
ncbi:hypothetical protein [Bradyrhizobium genosp. P]|uniref:hypothetical protein n=1 Tax=Bradyrhizobium genosp. P TaxID=83641 RepID=UPI003CED02C7